VPVRCQENELARFPPPPGLTCQQYAGPYAQQAGGYVETLAGGLCGFCQYANGDQFVSTAQTREVELLYANQHCHRPRTSAFTTRTTGAITAFSGSMFSSM